MYKNYRCPHCQTQHSIDKAEAFASSDSTTTDSLQELGSFTCSACGKETAWAELLGEAEHSTLPSSGLDIWVPNEVIEMLPSEDEDVEAVLGLEDLLEGENNDVEEDAVLLELADEDDGLQASNEHTANGEAELGIASSESPDIDIDPDPASISSDSTDVASNDVANHEIVYSDTANPIWETDESIKNEDGSSEPTEVAPIAFEHENAAAAAFHDDASAESDESVEQAILELELEAEESDQVGGEVEEISSEFVQQDSDASETQALEVDASTESDEQVEAESDDSPMAWASIASAPVRRRQEASFLRKVVPPVLGGFAAIPIAIGILWYGFGRDLGSTGPTVAKYVPWIVPKHLRGAGGNIMARNELNSGRSKSSRSGDLTSERPVTLDPTQRSFGEIGQRNKNTSASQQNDNADKAKKSASPESATSSVEPSPSPAASPRMPAAAPSMTEKGRSEESQPELEENGKGEDDSEVKPNATKEETKLLEHELEIRDAIDGIREMHSKWFSIPEEERLAFVLRYYDSLCLLSALVSNQISLTAQTQENLDKLYVEILESPKFCKSIEVVAAGKLKGARKLALNDCFAAVVVFQDNLAEESASEFVATKAKVILGGKEAKLRLRGPLVVNTSGPSFVIGQIAEEVGDTVNADIFISAPN